MDIGKTGIPAGAAFIFQNLVLVEKHDDHISKLNVDAVQLDSSVGEKDL